MKYKISKFCIISEDEQAISIFNSLSSNLIRFHNEAKEIIENMIKNNIFPNDKKILGYLEKNGIIVAESVDEDEVLLKKRKEIVDSTEILYLTILPTMSCNFKCRYCCEDTSFPEMISIETQDKIIAFIEKNINKFHKLVISWFGGEPLLAINVIESMSEKIKKICEDNGIMFVANMTTNGFFLTPQTLKRMIACNIINYCITIDGMEKIHDLQRPTKSNEGSWSRVISNLINIRDSDIKRFFSIIIRTNVTTQFMTDYEEYIKFLKKEFEKDHHFNFMWKKAEDWGNIETEDIYLISDRDSYLDFLFKKRTFRLRDNLTVKMLNVYDRICLSSLRNSLVIFPDGRISKCSRDVDKDYTTIGCIEDLEKKPEKLLQVSLVDAMDNKCFGCKKNTLCFGLGCPVENTECTYEMDYFREVIRSINDEDVLLNISNFSERDV